MSRRSANYYYEMAGGREEGYPIVIPTPFANAPTGVVEGVISNFQSETATSWTAPYQIMTPGRGPIPGGYIAIAPPQLALTRIAAEFTDGHVESTTMQQADVTLVTGGQTFEDLLAPIFEAPDPETTNIAERIAAYKSNHPGVSVARWYAA